MQDDQVQQIGGLVQTSPSGSKLKFGPCIVPARKAMVFKQTAAGRPWPSMVVASVDRSFAAPVKRPRQLFHHRPTHPGGQRECDWRAPAGGAARPDGRPVRRPAAVKTPTHVGMRPIGRGRQYSAESPATPVRPPRRGRPAPRRTVVDLVAGAGFSDVTGPVRWLQTATATTTLNQKVSIDATATSSGLEIDRLDDIAVGLELVTSQDVDIGLRAGQHDHRDRAASRGVGL